MSGNIHDVLPLPNKMSSTRLFWGWLTFIASMG